MDFEQLSTLYDQSKGEDEIQDQILFIYSHVASRPLWTS